MGIFVYRVPGYLTRNNQRQSDDAPMDKEKFVPSVTWIGDLINAHSLWHVDTVMLSCRISNLYVNAIPTLLTTCVIKSLGFPLFIVCWDWLSWESESNGTSPHSQSEIMMQSWLATVKFSNILFFLTWEFELAFVLAKFDKLWWYQ